MLVFFGLGVLVGCAVGAIGTFGVMIYHAAQNGCPKSRDIIGF